MVMRFSDESNPNFGAPFHKFVYPPNDLNSLTRGLTARKFRCKLPSIILHQERYMIEEVFNFNKVVRNQADIGFVADLPSRSVPTDR